MLNNMRVFTKVVELGSFSKAAMVLDMAPSSVARTIDALEDELAVTLLKRSTRQLTLTDKGQRFLTGATEILANADALFAALQDDHQTPKGHLRISVLETFGRLQIAPLLSEFMCLYPEVILDVELENRLMDIVGENIDIAIRIGKPQDSNLRARTLISNHTVVCATPDYFAKHGMPEHPNDLEKHNCLLLNRNRQSVFWYFNDAKVHVTGSLHSKGGTPLLEAALQGSGIVQLPRWMVTSYLVQGQLQQCLPDYDSALQQGSSGYVYAVYSKTSYPNPLIRLFIDFLLVRLKSDSV
ncbi:LysR family transcriptional regulator [Marinomonas agarivorans]|nr:LysR family transcriptional regulator [Marinomonas agarivorans]